MICVASFLILGILGIFSISYRELAREAFHCVFLRVRLRPCDTGFDTRMKSKITAKLMRFPRIAVAWRRHFEAISFAFTLIMAASSYFSAAAIYNLIRHGTCAPGEPCVIASLPEALSQPFQMPSGVAGTLNPHKVEVDFFFDEGACPNYARINEFFEQRIKANYPVIVNQYEINKPGNSELARRLARAYRTEPRIPMFFVGDVCIKECSRAALRQLEEAVRATIRSGASGPLSRLE